MPKTTQMAGVSTALVVVAALCWGLAGGIGGMLMANGWEAFVVALYRGVIGLLFILIWLALRPHGSGLASGRLWLWSMLAGVGVAGNFAFYYISIAQSSVAVAVTLMYCAPVFVFLVSFALRLERPTPLKWVAVALVMLGLVLLTRVYDIGAGVVTPISVGAGLLSGVCYAVFILGFKYAAPHGSPQAILVIAFAVLVALLFWSGDADLTIAVLSTSSLPLFVILGLLGTGISFMLYIAGLNHTAPTVASMVAMVEPVTATLFGVMVLNESLAGLQIFGMALILVTVTGLSVSSRAQQKVSQKAADHNDYAIAKQNCPSVDTKTDL